MVFDSISQDITVLSQIFDTVQSEVLLYSKVH